MLSLSYSDAPVVLKYMHARLLYVRTYKGKVHMQLARARRSTLGGEGPEQICAVPKRFAARCEVQREGTMRVSRPAQALALQPTLDAMLQRTEWRFVFIISPGATILDQVVPSLKDCGRG